MISNEIGVKSENKMHDTATLYCIIHASLTLNHKTRQSHIKASKIPLRAQKKKKQQTKRARENPKNAQRHIPKRRAVKTAKEKYPRLPFAPTARSGEKRRTGWATKPRKTTLYTKNERETHKARPGRREKKACPAKEAAPGSPCHYEFPGVTGGSSTLRARVSTVTFRRGLECARARLCVYVRVCVCISRRNCAPERPQALYTGLFAYRRQSSYTPSIHLSAALVVPFGGIFVCMCVRVCASVWRCFLSLTLTVCFLSWSLSLARVYFLAGLGLRAISFLFIIKVWLVLCGRQV